MGLILDADVIIAYEKRLFDLPGFFSRFPDSEFQMAAITVAEVRHGIERASSAFRARREQVLDVVLAFAPVLPYTLATAKIHARLWVELERSGQMIGAYDLIVAATAIEHGHAVVTFNQRHFEKVQGLPVLVPE